MTERFEDTMEVGYVRELRQNYLFIRAAEAQEEGYAARMMAGNTIEGLLKFRVRKSDNRSSFCYEITSKQPLGRLLETRTINAVQIRSLLLGIAQTLKRMEDYLLIEEQILLAPDYIYVDSEEYRPFLCLVPGKQGNFPEEFSFLLQYLLGKADHEDKEAVVLIYGLYRESLKENYGLDNLLGCLMKGDLKENCPKLDSSRERENHETIEPQSIEAWEPPQQGEAGKPGSSKQKQGYGYFLPGAAMFALAAGSFCLWGMDGLMAYGVWLAAAGLLLFAVGGGLFFWKASAHHNSRIPAIHFPIAQPAPAKKEAAASSDETGRWQMMFEEEAQTQAVPISGKSEEGEMNTVLLWNQEGKKEGRYLAGEDGSTIPLSYYPFIIGKQEGLCDYVILKNTISRLHLRIDESAQGYQLTDLNSTNGTYVNGRCLDANETVAIHPGDKIGIADLTFCLK